MINMDGLTEAINSLGFESGFHINTDHTLSAITSCCDDESRAKTELEYYCLNLASEQCCGSIYSELDQILHFLMDFGTSLHKRLKETGVYYNGLSPYAYRNRRYDTIRLLRKDVLQDIIKKELAEDGLYSIARTLGSQYQRTL